MKISFSHPVELTTARPDNGFMEKTVRFGIGSESAGRKASSWRLWTNGGKDYSVYLACREIGKAVHTSFHEGGRWHTCFRAEQFSEMFALGQQPESRFLGQSEQPVEFSPGWTMAALIYTPLRAMRGKISGAPKGMVWVPPPASNQHCEMAVLLGSDATDRVDWPGHLTMGTQLIGRFEIGNGSQAAVVYRYVPEQELRLPPVVQPRYFNGVTESRMTDGPLSTIMLGSGPYGATTFFEEAVELKPTEPVAG